MTRDAAWNTLAIGILLTNAGNAAAAELSDLALQPPQVITELGPDHLKSSRGAQGVPAVERAAKGRLWAAWYAGKSRRGVESSSSYVVLATSGDDGSTWTEKMVLQAPRFCHTYDPCLWIDPEKLAPYTLDMLIHDLGDERGSNVYRSTDQGRTFARIGQVRIPGTRVDEHMILERRDGSLWMLMRNTRGIAQSVSTDGGRTWSEGSIYLAGRTHANKRFFIRRLESGALLLVRNNSPDGQRAHMTAFVSDDEGETWQGGLVLDERESSYPDGVQAADGTIYVIYDHQRYTLNRAGKAGVGSVQMAVFDEDDVRAGKPLTDKVRLRVDVTRLRTLNE